MPEFSLKSRSRLRQCDPELQELFSRVIEHFDCTIITGHRGEDEQNRMVNEGRSQVSWPDSKHNTRPSLAVDAAPWPIDWEDRERFYYFGGFVMGMAISMGIQLRYGGDWDQDTDVKDNSFDDLLHYELVR